MAQPEPENVPGFFDRRRASVPDETRTTGERRSRDAILEADRVGVIDTLMADPTAAAFRFGGGRIVLRSPIWARLGVASCPAPDPSSPVPDRRSARVDRQLRPCRDGGGRLGDPLHRAGSSSAKGACGCRDGTWRNAFRNGVVFPTLDHAPVVIEHGQTYADGLRPPPSSGCQALAPAVVIRSAEPSGAKPPARPAIVRRSGSTAFVRERPDEGRPVDSR